MINPNNYKILQNTWTCSDGNKVYLEKFSFVPEGFNVTYAVRGPITNTAVGGREWNTSFRTNTWSPTRTKPPKC